MDAVGHRTVIPTDDWFVDLSCTTVNCFVKCFRGIIELRRPNDRQRKTSEMRVQGEAGTRIGIKMYRDTDI